MQNFTMYVCADQTIGTVVDRLCEKTMTPPSLTRGVSVCLNIRLFKEFNDRTPYPISVLSAVDRFAFYMDDDFDSESNYIIVADNDSIEAKSVTEESGGVSETYTEISIPISETNTEELEAIIGTREFVPGINGELIGYNNNNEEVFILQLKGFVIRNRIKSDGVPTSVASDYYTKHEVDDLLASFTGGVSSVNGKTADDDGVIVIGAVDINTSRNDSVDNELLSKVSSVNGCFPDGNGEVWISGGVIPVNGMGLEQALDEKVSSINGVFPSMGVLDLWATHIYMNGTRTDSVYDAVVSLESSVANIEDSIMDIGSAIDDINGEVV